MRLTVLALTLTALLSTLAPGTAAAQARAYAEQLGVPFVFLSNGDEVRFWDWQREAFPRPVKTIFKQDDLERRVATLAVRRDPVSVAIDKRIVERDYQVECIDTLCREIGLGRRKLLVEMATGTGKTRTAAAFIKRLFEANAITRVLFLVDRIPLAKQTEDAFAEHLPDYPAYVLRAGRRFQDEKRITITTLQSMVNLYADYSSGYFDLVISDECHRSIYGQWSGVLRHFDGVQVGQHRDQGVDARLDDGPVAQRPQVEPLQQRLSRPAVGIGHGGLELYRFAGNIPQFDDEARCGAAQMGVQYMRCQTARCHRSLLPRLCSPRSCAGLLLQQG